MKIDRRLNLVIPVDIENGTVYVHSTPIRQEVFDAYFMEIAKTFSAIYGEGLGMLAGPRVAANVLKKVATELNRWDGPAGVERGLMAEIRRLSNVIAPSGNGWAPLPFDQAVKQGLLDAADVAEVENAIVFFTVVSFMHRRAEVREILEGAAQLWGAQVESSSVTEFTASLPISTPPENSGATIQPSSVPI